MAVNAIAAQHTGVCAPIGYRAAAAAAGIRGDGDDARLDTAIVVSDTPCVAAGVFTRNVVKAAPVVMSQLALRRGRPAQAVVLNSGNANACTGPQGFRDALRMTSTAAECCDLDPADVLVCSTGVIGRPLPMDRVVHGIRAAAASLSAHMGEAVARAIMTTDTVPKCAAATASIRGVSCTVGGMAKGAGMLHPDMATLLSVITTDAAAGPAVLHAVLTDVTSRTFNCLSVDGDTSTNDTVLLLANGAAGEPSVDGDNEAVSALTGAVEAVATSLVEQLAADAEGATRSICVTVRGATDDSSARRTARTVVQSPLVKTAVHGGDPNWGRIVAAVGRSGATFVLDRCRVSIGGVEVFANGQPVAAPEDVQAAFSAHRVEIAVDLGAGDGAGRSWGCDLSPEYVRINAEYTT